MYLFTLSYTDLKKTYIFVDKNCKNDEMEKFRLLFVDRILKTCFE